MNVGPELPANFPCHATFLPPAEHTVTVCMDRRLTSFVLRRNFPLMSKHTTCSLTLLKSAGMNWYAEYIQLNPQINAAHRQDNEYNMHNKRQETENKQKLKQSHS